MAFTRTIISGASQLMLGAGVVRLFFIVTMPILTRLLSPQAYGGAALAGTVISLASVFALAGIDMSYARAITVLSRRAELLPPESLDRLIAAVTKSIGPIAPLIVRDQIASLGESYSAFPKRRIGELVTLLQQEITQRTYASQVQESARNSKA